MTVDGPSPWSGPPPRTVADVLRRRALTSPDRTAIVCDDRTWSFAEVEARANRAARAVMASTAAGDRIALLDSNSDAFYALLFGVARCGRVLVPINFRLTDHEIAYILNDSGARVLVLGREFAGRAAGLRAACPAIDTVVVIDDTIAEARRYSDWLDAGDASDPAEDGDETTPVLLVYTSGTTGRPRGATLTHANVLVTPPVLLREYGCGPDDVALVCLPLFHVSGGLWGLSSLYAGMPTVILRASAATDILSAVQAHRVTKVFLVPALLQWLVDHCQGFDCSTLDLVVYGASPISPALLRAAAAAFHCRFAQLYGLTETAGAVTYLTPDDHRSPDDQRLQSCGRPLPGVELRIVDETGADVAAGAIGEIVVRGRQIMRGYWQASDETDAAFRGDWFRTGDAGVMDASGYVYLRDRLKDMIISGGEKIYPAEVEQVLSRHPAVAEVAVYGTPDPRWGEAVACAVVTVSGRHVDLETLRAFALERLARFKVPSRVSFPERLPRNAAGKVLKRELRAAADESA